MMKQKSQDGEPCSTGVARRRPADLPVLRTDNEVKHADPGVYRISGVQGLRLHVHVRGDRIIRTFRIQYRTKAGRVRHTSIGVYGDIALKDARDEAGRIRNIVGLGGDPAADRAQERATVGGEGTLAELSRRFIASPTAKRAAEVTQRNRTLLLGRYVERNPIGKYRAAEVSRFDLVAWGEAIAEHSPSAAHSAHAALRRVYTWAVDSGILPGHPFGFRAPGEKPRSDRVLSLDEIRVLVRVCRAQPDKYRQAVMLLLLTGVRESNVTQMTLSEIEGLDADPKSEAARLIGLPRWIIPSQRLKMKGRGDHIVPLSRQAVALIKARRLEAEKGYLFPPTVKTKTARPYMRWHRYQMEKLEQAMELAAGRPIPDWHVHNLRHTIATQMREVLKVDRDVVRKILIHAGASDVTDIYERSTLIDERREALQRWADFVDEVSR